MIPLLCGLGLGMGETVHLRDSAASSQQLVGAKRSVIKCPSPSPLITSLTTAPPKPFVLLGRASPHQLPVPPGVSCTLSVFWLGGREQAEGVCFGFL